MLEMGWREEGGEEVRRVRLLHRVNRILCHRLNNDRTVDRKLCQSFPRVNGGGT